MNSAGGIDIFKGLNLQGHGGFDMSALYKSMATGFWTTCKSIFHAIPLPLLLFIVGLFVFMGIWSFLKELKVI